jgi:NitT/TauT family transport system permease protein
MRTLTSSSEHALFLTREEEYASNAKATDSASHDPVRRRNRRARDTRTTNPILASIPPLVLGALILVAWYLATVGNHSYSLLLPAPADVVSRLLSGIGSGLLVSNALITVQESLLGFVIAVAVALPLGYAIAKSRLFAITLQPYIAAGQAIPSSVIAPFLYIWFGTGVLSVVVVCVLVVVFPMIINTMLGIQTIDHEVLDAARLDGASGLSLLAYMEFPLALPAILAGVRTGLTLSIIGALVGEFFCNPDQGLGALVQIALHQYDVALMFAAIIILAVLAAGYYAASWILIKLAELAY